MRRTVRNGFRIFSLSCPLEKIFNYEISSHLQRRQSDKFWNIEVSGKSFTVTYGKAGTNAKPHINF
ncbi:hypothetical protein LEP1GSC008_3942 [Leptospira kirschneri serovar Bulgarica str. Nikolaevo]|uniref:WGR domain-containing protein n=1 Tax=Leptospira kirschneri serovar Bulgarica str. Nikolaevo TaxID=1240687 RepID=M6FNX9_9LEPT|nr:hypothetical protein LEP1GSC008_3942 [Leptospira kirschneri serovar Bulgarica str. Nikolaevo]